MYTPPALCTTIVLRALECSLDTCVPIRGLQTVSSCCSLSLKCPIPPFKTKHLRRRGQCCGPPDTRSRNVPVAYPQTEERETAALITHHVARPIQSDYRLHALAHSPTASNTITIFEVRVSRARRCMLHAHNVIATPNQSAPKFCKS
jgi:hypothetical protein